jgi:hypothetical protein
MQRIVPRQFQYGAARIRPTVFLVGVVLASLSLSSCGSGGTPGPVLTGTTQVTLLISSTANSQVSQFNLGFSGFTLTSQSGKVITLFSTNQNAEFIHLNSNLETLLTATIPQDVYTAATATVGPANFTCSALTPTGGLEVNTYAYGATPANQVVVNVAAPITITGTAMGLSLNLQASQSASFPAQCFTDGISPFSITPTFSLSPVIFSTDPTKVVKENGLEGRVSAVSAANNSFSLTLADGQTLMIGTSDLTSYQGINSFAELTAGAILDMDAMVQPDGSLLATRIEVNDTDTANLSVASGPVLETNTTIPLVVDFATQHQGYLTDSRQASLPEYYSYGSAAFQISARYANLPNLPFPANFTSATMFPGQNVYITTHATSVAGGPNYLSAASVTLMSQTINGLIAEVASDGAFTVYTITLAPYDLIPQLSVQAGQTTALTNPNTAVVYVDSNTQMLSSKPLAAGSVIRFTGLLFNDGGTARMDCGQVNDGVPQ